MPKSRAHKEQMGPCGVVKRGGVSESKTGPANVHQKNKQYNFPKDTAAVGPHYDQDNDEGIVTTGIIK